MNERKFLIRNVKKARDLINGKLKITPKDKNGDLVTNFDLDIEKFLIKKIKRTYPDFEIISEEFNSDKELSKNCFVIDPIDGTNNFARKIPLWGMQIACIKNNEVVASVIYLPVYEELYSADKSGAYLNDEKIHIGQQDEKTGIYSMEQSISRSYEIQQKNHNCRLFGSAAFTLSMVACGKTGAAMFKDTIHPWDIIPGEYLVKQAGGISFVNDNIKVCANSTCWTNLLTTKEIEQEDEEIAEPEQEIELQETERNENEEPKEQAEKNIQEEIIAFEEMDKNEEEVEQNQIDEIEEIEQELEQEQNEKNNKNERNDNEKIEEQEQGIDFEETEYIVEKKIIITEPEPEPEIKQEPQTTQPEPIPFEEPETIIETFVVTEDDEDIEPPIITKEAKSEEKVVKPTPKPVQSIIKKPSLTEARRRKIIM